MAESAVYPRVCGGTRRRESNRRTRPGLSPRVRGNPRRQRLSPAARRSIPACAGEPDRCGYGYWQQRVYPRVCGGTGSKPVSVNSVTGLSPRVRGNRLLDYGIPHGIRSIPACAGEPHEVLIRSVVRKVYPRVCGGTAAAGFDGIALRGLSPRVRGNHNRQESIQVASRSIPACAGEPPNRPVLPCVVSVYPRVCGGTGDIHQYGHALIGLSPRVRGNRVGICPR